MIGKTRRILIVDDEEDILISMKMLVESMGYETRTANNGNTALTMLQKEKFDLVLLDILMPKMSGREVLEQIRKNPKTKKQLVAMISVVQLSHPGEEVMKKLKPIDYFQKPIDNADFKKRLRRILK